MTGRKKLTPIEVFDLAMEDADHLVALVDGFTNQRKYKMRKELRERIGDALKVPAKDRKDLDCLESSDVFLIFKPNGGLARADFVDGRPLLRQALIAACSAFESYLGDKVMNCVGPLLKSADTLSPRLGDLPLTLSDWMKIDVYQRKRWGVRQYVVEPAVRKASSTAPNQVGALLAMLGVDAWSKKIDTIRKVQKGTTVKDLDRITDRRNKIAHDADRKGGGRAMLTIDEVRADVAILRSVVKAIEATV